MEVIANEANDGDQSGFSNTSDSEYEPESSSDSAIEPDKEEGLQDHETKRKT